MRGPLAAACLLALGGAWALEVPPAPAPGARWGYVSDFASALSDAEKDALEARLKDLDRSDSTQVAVVLLPSLEGEALEDFSVRLAQSWGIGRKGKDNGVLLLVALEDRALRIEVGYGLEGRLTDALCSRIIRDEIVPRFKAGDVPGGIEAGVQAITQAVRGEYRGGGEGTPAGNLFGAVLLIVCILFVLAMLRGARSGRFLGRSVNWMSTGGTFGGGRSFGGGGFGGFGGGSFGGGGSSGRW